MRSTRRISVVNRNLNNSVLNVPNLSGPNNKSTIFSEGVNLNYMKTFQSDPSSPRHISISYSSVDHSLIFESVVLFYSVLAYFLQLLHLYRTVWWLPQSYENNAVKFYLVNPYIMGFVLLLIIPRWLWTCCKIVISSTLPNGLQGQAKHYCQVVLLSVLGTIYLYLIFVLTTEETNEEKASVKTNPVFKLGCLMYPILLLVATYGDDIKSYLDLVPSFGGSLNVHHHQHLNQVKHKCSNDPVVIRQEADVLRKDFNRRLRNVLFHSYLIAVTCTLLPCCFAQVFVHFDVNVVIQHFILVWAGNLTLNAVHAFPPNYCHTLHSCARHLGCWDRLGPKAKLSLPYVDWSPQTVWKQGSIVMASDDEIYCARSDLNSAEPGSTHHKRFYRLFIHAALFQISLLVFQLLLVLLQLVLLLRSSEWYQMISLSLLQASGGYALFKLLRDAVVVWRLSLAEDMLTKS